MSSTWSTVLSEETVNEVLNPSGEQTGNFVARGSATVTRDTTYARYGIYSYKVATTASGDGIDLTTGTLGEHAYYNTLYLHGVIPNQLQVSLDDTNWNDIDFLSGSIYDTIREGWSAHWPLNETSGTRTDSTGNGSALTDNNTVTYAAGLNNDNAAQFTSANSETLSVVDNAILSAGDRDFSLIFFFRPDDLDAQGIMGKYETTGNQREYYLQIASNLLRWTVSSDGTGANTFSISASTFGALTAGTWYMGYAYHDSVNNLIGVSVNMVETTLAHTAGVFGGTAPFEMGRNRIQANYYDGRLYRVSFFNKLLSAAEQTAYYNDGMGLAFTGNRWSRMGVSIPLAQANASTTLRIRQNGAGVGNFWIDAVQSEKKNGYYTSYGDGDQSGWRWNGLRHGSTSTRDAQHRLGGREVDLQDYLGIRVIQETGWGMPDQMSNLQDMSINPGAIYQNTKIGTRTLTLTLDFTTGPDTITTIPGLHQRRQKFIDAVKSSRNRGDQPMVWGYKAANDSRTAYVQLRYVDGLKGLDISSGGTVMEAQGKVPVTFLAVDPYFYADDRDTATLDFTDALLSDYAYSRINGQWSDMVGTPFNGTVYSIVVDKARGRIFYFGNFTTANGVTVNGATYWNGTTFVAMGGATKGVAGGNVYRGVVAANGDVWVVGAITSAGGSATKGVARWNNSTDTWTVFNLASTTGTTWYTITIDDDGILYLFGDLTNWNSIAAADYCAMYTPSSGTWAAIGTSPFSATEFSTLGYASAVDKNGYVVVGTTGAGVAGHLRRWDGSAWSDLGATSDIATARDIFCVFVLPDNSYLVGGSYTTLGGIAALRVAKYNQSTFSALGNGMSQGQVYCIDRDSDGLIALSGNFIPTDLVGLRQLVYWNGYTYAPPDISISVAHDVYACQFDAQDNLYLGSDDPTNSTVAGITTVTTTSTEFVYPIVTITGPTTANTTCTLQWLENQSSGQRCYFYFTINSGETVTVDFRPNSDVLIKSDWRGEITDQPLDNSDFDLRLLPGANTISAYVGGTTTGVTLLVNADVVHLSVDGVA